MGLFNNIELAREIEDLKIRGTKEYIAKRQKKAALYTVDYLELDEKGVVFCMEDLFLV